MVEPKRVLSDELISLLVEMFDINFDDFVHLNDKDFPGMSNIIYCKIYQ